MTRGDGTEGGVEQTQAGVKVAMIDVLFDEERISKFHGNSAKPAPLIPPPNMPFIKSAAPPLSFRISTHSAAISGHCEPRSKKQAHHQLHD